MKHFATLALPDGVYACTANPDGSIPLSSREVARASMHDRDGNNLRYLVEQANAAHELAAALAGLMAHFPLVAQAHDAPAARAREALGAVRERLA